MNITRLLASALAPLVLAGAGFVTSELNNYDGPARWESTSVTISADLEEAASYWGHTLDFKVVPADKAQIRTQSESFSDKGVGGEAQSTYRDGNYLASCTIALPEGKTDPAILTHEFGHCLGLTHRAGVEDSNMHWWAKDYIGGWSDAVTDSDLEALIDLYS